MPTGLSATLSRSAVLLEAAARGGGLQFAEAIAALDTVPSTASRLLRALDAAGLLARGTDGRYRAAPRLRRLAAALSGTADLETEAAATVEALGQATGEAAAVFTPVEDGVRLVAKHEPPERFRYMPVGGVNRGCDRHAFCLLRAAWWGAREARRRLAAAAPAVPAAPWLKRLPGLKRAAWIVNARDDQPGIARVAVAVLDAAGEPRALVGITATAPTVAAREGELLREVRNAAEALARRLGAQP
jgi:DNA-binding IclR family transcriptional regulator